MKEWKICKNPKCRKKFHRSERHTNHQWRLTLFHDRRCQVDMYNRERKGTKKRAKYATDPRVDCQAFHDALNTYLDKAKKRLKKSVIIYSSENMTQEELQALIPSGGGGCSKIQEQ